MNPVAPVRAIVRDMGTISESLASVVGPASDSKGYSD
jgi:hypothetical protein